jgi:hypothetical protein
MNHTYTLWSADDGSVTVELMGNVGEDGPHIATTLSPSKIFDQESGEFRSIGFIPSKSPSLGGNEDASDNPGDIHTPCRTLFVNIVNGNAEKPICFAVSPLYSIANIKSMIHDVLSIAPDQQALFYAEEQLDDNESLEACQIEDEATINAIVWQVDDTSTKETESLAQEKRPVVMPHMNEPGYTQKPGTKITQFKNSRRVAERNILVGPLHGSSADPVELNPTSMMGSKGPSTSFPERLALVRKRKLSALRQAPHNTQQSSWKHIRENGPLPDTPTAFARWHPFRDSGTNYDDHLPTYDRPLVSLEDSYNHHRLGHGNTTAHALASLSSGTQQPLAALFNSTTDGRPNYPQTSLRGSQLSSSHHDELTDGFLSRKDRPPANFEHHRPKFSSRMHRSAKLPSTSRVDPTHGFPMDKLRSSPDYLDRWMTSPTPARPGGASLRDHPAYETGDYPGYDFAREETRSSPDYIPSFIYPPPQKQSFAPSRYQATPDYMPTFETQPQMLQDNILRSPATETNDRPIAPTQLNCFPEYTLNRTPSSFMSMPTSSRIPHPPWRKSDTLSSLWSSLNANDSVALSSFANDFSAKVSQQIPSHRSLSPSDFSHEDNSYPSRHTQSYASRLSETTIYSSYTSSVPSISTLPPLAQDILPPDLVGARTVQQLIELQGWKMSAQEWRQVRNALEGDGEAQRNIQVLSAKLAGARAHE